MSGAMHEGAKMSDNRLRLSLVCPAFEEEEALPAFHEQLLAVVDSLGDTYDIEIIYIDDGSRDGTLGHLRRWARVDSRVRYLSLSRNFGHQAALTAGLEHAHGDLIITLDSDLQHPPQLIPTLLEKYHQGSDIVLTIRAEDPNLGWFKRHGTRWFYKVMGWLSDTETRPAAADFRLMTRKSVEALLRLRESHRYLRGMVQWLGFPSTEIPYTPARRVAGVSKFSLRKMFAFASDAIFSFSRFPLRMAVFLGIGFGGVGLILGLTALVRLLADWSVYEIDSVLVILSALGLVGGSILATLGILGEYIGRIYDQVKGRPIYLLKETDRDAVSSGGLLRPTGPAIRSVRPGEAA